jgi:hypothetical protein
MSGPDDCYLSALRLSRALAQELPNTRSICLNNSWNPALANEVRLHHPIGSECPDSHITNCTARRGRNSAIRCPARTQHSAKPSATYQPPPTRAPLPHLQFPRRRRVRRPGLTRVPAMEIRRAQHALALDDGARRRPFLSPRSVSWNARAA